MDRSNDIPVNTNPFPSGGNSGEFEGSLVPHNQITFPSLETPQLSLPTNTQPQPPFTYMNTFATNSARPVHNRGGRNQSHSRSRSDDVVLQERRYAHVRRASFSHEQQFSFHAFESYGQSVPQELYVGQQQTQQLFTQQQYLPQYDNQQQQMVFSQFQAGGYIQPDPPSIPMSGITGLDNPQFTSPNADGNLTFAQAEQVPQQPALFGSTNTQQFQQHALAPVGAGPQMTSHPFGDLQAVGSLVLPSSPIPQRRDEKGMPVPRKRPRALTDPDMVLKTNSASATPLTAVLDPYARAPIQVAQPTTPKVASKRSKTFDEASVDSILAPPSRSASVSSSPSRPFSDSEQPDLHCGADDTAEDSEDTEEGKRPWGTGRKKIRIEYINEKLKRQITFSKRKSGLMKKVYEMTTLTGTEALLVLVSETGHIYSYATKKLSSIVSDEEKNPIREALSEWNVELKAMKNMAFE